MAKPASALGYADSRPRIHIWPGRDYRRPRYSIGPTGVHSQEYPSVGIAIDAALGRIGGVQQAVVIIEPAT